MLEQRFHQLQKIVLALSGGNEEILALTRSERARFESLGWAILITSGVATVSMWFALASAVGINGILALPIALAWGLVIMGIDRWLIVSMPVEGRRKFAMAVPRLALALLLGTLISTPLVLRIFQSEINAQIAKMQQTSYNTFLQQQQASDVAKQVSTYSSELQYLNTVIATHGATTANTAADPELEAYNQQLSSLNAELTHWTSLKNQYYTDYICQLYGGPTCPKKGLGPAAKDSEQNYEEASQEVDTLKGQINDVQAEIQQRDAQLSSSSAADQQARYQQALAQQPIVKNEYDTALQRQNELQASFFATNQASHGILIRLEALSQLSNGNFTVTAARFLLFLLFLVIECLPVTVKLLQRPGVYEEVLHYQREAERKDASKFFQSRWRPIGPTGTAVLPPMLRLEPEYRIDSIWTEQRALPGSLGSEGSEVSEDDEPTRLAGDDSGRHWAHVEYASAGGHADRDRPEQLWYGRDRWRNYWPQQPAEADEPPTADNPPVGYGIPVPPPDPGDMLTRADFVQAAGAPGADDRPRYEPYVRSQAHRDEHDPGVAYDGSGLYASDGFRVQGYRDERSGDDAWDDNAADWAYDVQAPVPAVPPGTGGIPLSWDDDE